LNWFKNHYFMYFVPKKKAQYLIALRSTYEGLQCFFKSIMHKCIWRSVFVPICVHFPSIEGNEKMAWNTYFWGLLWRVKGAKIWSLCAWIYAWMNSNLFFTVNRNLFECFKHDIAYANSMLWMFASIFMVFCQLLTSFVLVNNY
jgi:hypothetical protein